MAASNRTLRPAGNRISVKTKASPAAAVTDATAAPEIEADDGSDATAPSVEPARPAVRAKAERGKPTRGKVRPERKARATPARPLRLKPGMPLAKAASKMAASAVGLVATGWRRVQNDSDLDAPHALRVGLRRLRVVLHIFRDHIEDTADAGLRKALAKTGREISRLRDLDVMLGEIVKPLLSHDEIAGGQALIAMLEAERARASTEVRNYLRGDEARALLQSLESLPDRLAAAVEATGDKRTLAKAARRDIGRRWHKLAKQAAHLDTLDAAGQHEVRKSLKNLRYAFGYFAPSWGRKTSSSFEAHLRRLQSTFGYLNDVASAKKLEARISADAHHAETNCAIGYVLGRHTERAKKMHAKLIEQYETLAASKLALELAE